MDLNIAFVVSCLAIWLFMDTKNVAGLHRFNLFESDESGIGQTSLHQIKIADLSEGPVHRIVKRVQNISARPVTTETSTVPRAEATDDTQRFEETFNGLLMKAIIDKKHQCTLAYRKFGPFPKNFDCNLFTIPGIEGNGKQPDSAQDEIKFF